MKTITDNAPRVREAMAFLNGKMHRPMIAGEIGAFMGINVVHARSLLRGMALAGRCDYLVVRGVRFYGPRRKSRG